VKTKKHERNNLTHQALADNPGRRQQRPIARTRILGVDVHDVTIEEALQRIQEMIEARTPHHIVTVNPEFVMIAQKHDEFRDVLNRADLQVADGIGIVWASRVNGKRIRGRVTGVDLVNAFSRLAGEQRYRLYLLGAAPGVAEIAARILADRHPGLVIVGTYSGSPRREEESQICDRIRQARPDVLLVAFGAPMQDIWIRRTMDILKVPVSIGVGGTFDFIAGVQTRAPGWMRELGLEWLYRLVREPRRWRRMLRLPRFVAAVIGSRVRLRIGRANK